MSISLDIALYLRDNPTKHSNLSLCDRAVLFTLAFRVGSNTMAWVSQKELAKELNVTPRGLRKNLSCLVKEKLIVITPSHIDKRKNHYAIAEFLINYHQLRRTPEPKSSSINKKNKGNLSSYQSDERGICGPFISEDKGTNSPLLNQKNMLQHNDFTNEISQKNCPKVTIKSKETLKAKQKEHHRQERDVVVSEPIVLPDWLKEDLWSEFLQHRKSIRSPMSDLAQRKAFNILWKFKEEGQDVEQIINNSIVNGWKGLFPIKLIKDGGNGNNNGSNSKEEPFDDMAVLLEWAGYKSVADIGPLTKFVSR